MAWQDVAAKVASGFAGAVGNTQAQEQIGQFQQRREGERQSELQQRIMPHGIAIQGLRQKLSTLDPNSTEYNDTVHQIQENVHAMREILHPDVKLGAGDWLKTHTTDRLHITNHDKRERELQARQAAGVSRDTESARALAQGTIDEVGQPIKNYRRITGQEPSEDVREQYARKTLGVPEPKASYDVISGTVNGQPVTFQRNKADATDLRNMDGNPVPPDVARAFVATPKSTAGNKPTLKTEPSSGHMSYIYPPDAANPNGRVVPVLDANGKPFGGFKPETVRHTVNHRWIVFTDANNQTHLIPKTEESDSTFGPMADKNEQSGAPLAPDPGPNGEVPGASSTGGKAPGAPSPRGGTTPSPKTKPVVPGKTGGLPPGTIDLGRGKLPASDTSYLQLINPAVQQTDEILKTIEDLGLKDDNTPGKLFKARALYSVGVASPEGSLGSKISDLNLDAITSASAALKGSTRSLSALKLALVHTPNPWVDSPALMYQKLKNINDRLKNAAADIVKGDVSTAEKLTGTTTEGSSGKLTAADLEKALEQ